MLTISNVLGIIRAPPFVAPRPTVREWVAERQIAGSRRLIIHEEADISRKISLASFDLDFLMLRRAPIPKHDS